jgi:hypothetical protein
LSAYFSFFVCQPIMITLLTIVGGGAVSRVLFGASGAAHGVEIRLVLIQTIGVLALQGVTSVLGGLARVEQASWVGIVTSFLTLATAYPLLLLGRIGLTFVIGLTCFIGAAIGAVLAWRASGLSLRQFAPVTTWRSFHEALPISRWLILGPIILNGSVLAVQSLVTRGYGLVELGQFNAAWTLETTAIAVLTSSMRSYYLPTLGRLDTFAQKRAFASNTLTLLLVLLLLGVATLILGAQYLIRILFTASFGPARDILLILALSMPGQIFIWCHGLFVLHKGDYRAYLWLDAVWVSIRVVGTAVCVAKGYSVFAVAWVEVIALSVSAVVDVVAVRRLYGGAIIDTPTIALGVAVVVLLALGRAFADTGKLLPQIAFGAAVVALSVVIGKRSLAKWSSPT